MRILVILAIIGGIIYLCYSKISASMAERIKPTTEHVEPKKELSDIRPDLLPGKPLEKAQPVKLPKNDQGRIESASVFFTHQFKNRLAPKIPEFLKTKKEVSIALDEQTNTWIIECSDYQAPHLKKVVSMLDVSPEELDIDFVLLAVSEKWIRSIGVNLTFAEGASFLSSVGIYDTTGGLRFASGSVALDISGEKSNEHVTVYRTPVIRTLEGESWKLSEVIETPIPVTQTIDGVSTSSIEYTSFGLTLTGKLSKGSKGWRMDLEQVNGSKGADVNLDPYVLPERRRQELKTAVYLEEGKWTICGGVRNIEKTTKRGLLYKKDGVSKDLVLIFARPRTSLRKIYKAVPPFSPNNIQRDAQNSLLPSKS